MARNRYMKDYRLIEQVDERGRIHTDYEYIGKDYRYAAGLETVRREKRAVTVLCALGWLAYLGGLVPNSGAMHAVYAALPYLFAALPLGFLTDVILTAMPDREPLRHSQADKLEKRYPAASMWTAILAAASLAGGLARLALRGGGWEDIPFFLCAALLAGVGFFAFSRRGRFACLEK